MTFAVMRMHLRCFLVFSAAAVEIASPTEAPKVTIAAVIRTQSAVTAQRSLRQNEPRRKRVRECLVNYNPSRRAHACAAFYPVTVDTQSKTDSTKLIDR